MSTTPTASAAPERARLSSADVSEITGNPPYVAGELDGACAGNGRYFIPQPVHKWPQGWGFREVSRRRFWCWVWLRSSFGEIIPGDIALALIKRSPRFIA